MANKRAVADHLRTINSGASLPTPETPPQTNEGWSAPRDGVAFVPVSGQSFKSKQEWIVYATRRLTSHPEYNNTQHGDTKGWRGHHFTALCFDQLGRRVRNGGDFQRAEDDNAYPVWWIWPDQIAPLLMPAPTPEPRA